MNESPKPIYLDIELAERKGFQVRQMVVDRGEYALHSYPVYNAPASVAGKD